MLSRCLICYTEFGYGLLARLNQQYREYELTMTGRAAASRKTSDYNLPSRLVMKI